MQVHIKFKRNTGSRPLYFAHPKAVFTEKDMSLQEALQNIEKYIDEGCYIVPSLSYEAKEGGPFIIGVFESPVERSVFQSAYGEYGGYSMGRPEFIDSPSKIKGDIEEIRKYIKDGHTYQVNYTTRLRGGFRGNAHALFEQLTSRNNGDYAAFIHYGEDTIVSCSPELFFEKDAYGKISARPMKGTSRRYKDPREDQKSYDFLRHSKKDRAENVMIVDLLRNDLSKLAEKGSVRVPELFAIEQYETVYQMTSKIEAQLMEGRRTADIIDALFPCGSITGAPKRSTIDIISRLESTPRGYYCGAIGIIHPDRSEVFNVPIRTMHIREGQFEYGAGGGITYDSLPAAEYDEIVAKTAFLEAGRYKLIETMRFESGEIARLDLHEARVDHSSRSLGFRQPDFKEALVSYLRHHALPEGTVFKVRALIDDSGEASFTHEEMGPTGRMQAKIHNDAIDSPAEFLSNKTSIRHHYEGVSNEFPLVLYYNKRHQITEFNLGNLVVMEKDGYFTPSVDTGLLEGVMRTSLISDGVISERDYDLDEFIRRYEQGEIEVYMINSLREWVEVNLDVQR